MERFDFVPTPIDGLIVVRRQRLEDHRGFFSRFYCADEFAKVGVAKPIAQINHTFTRSRGAVRGMHFQRPPHAETKLVSCLQGEVFDVAIDLRKHSPTYLQWHSTILSAKNQNSLLIPDGFAHGFQTLTEDCELLYLHTAAHNPSAEDALNANDPMLNINWPLNVTEMSDRDRTHPLLTAEFEGIAP